MDLDTDSREDGNNIASTEENIQSQVRPSKNTSAADFETPVTTIKDGRNLDKNLGSREECDSSMDTAGGAKSRVTFEKIIPTETYRRSRRVDHEEPEGFISLPQNLKAGSVRPTSEPRRINPHQVGDWSELLDRINTRTQSGERSSARASARKPEGHYKVLHNRGRQDQL